MATRATWCNQLTIELAEAMRKTEAARHRFGLACLMDRLEGAQGLVIAARERLEELEAEQKALKLATVAAASYIGDDGHISNIFQGRIHAATASEIQQIRDIAGAGSLDEIKARLVALDAPAANTK